MENILIALVIGYFLGSIPFGLVLCRIAGYGDIRKIGSGNIGATNVLRTGNKVLALATLLLDSGKGAIAVGITYSWYFYNKNVEGQPIVDLTNMFHPSMSINVLYLSAALGAILGHCFPIWLKFKGGKGVATTLGSFLAAVPFAGLTCCLTWLIVAFISRISSLSALIAMLAAPIAVFVFYADPVASALAGGISLIVWVKHHQNIARILKGEEPKIGKKKKAEAAEETAENVQEK